VTIHIVTDSTSDLTPEQAGALGVRVVPLTVIFGEEQFLDGVELRADDFYRRLSKGSVMPTTSQPSPEQFGAVFRELLRDDDDSVLSIHLSEKWSGTVQAAHLAAKEFDGRVHVVDSGTVSVGIQFLIRAALRDRGLGTDVTTVVKNTEARSKRIVVYVLLDTITFLHRGGRIGRAQAFLGGVLNVKPLLRVVDGEAHPQARVRNRQQGITRLLELVTAAGPLEAVGVMDTDTPEAVDDVRRRLEAAYPELDLVCGQLGAVVGTYAGPGAIGVAFMRGASSA
jgi:DegV family protein with EDD domain